MKCLLAIAGLFAFALTFTPAKAQTKNVTGHISDRDGITIPGVNVVEKGTQNGTASDQEGNYSIDVNAGATLVFSFIGYKTQEVAIGELSIKDMTLKEDVIYCGPWLNTGYGYTKPEEMPGAGVYQSDFNRGNIYDPNQLAQGRVAGLSIYNRGGNPNADYTLRIRGLSSFDPDASPLIVIDGVLNATTENLDPQDVESMTVLKDASAAAIYGIRASAGVILITTKKGSQSPGVTVSLRTEGAASTMLKKQPSLSASEFVAIGGADLGSSTDWQDEITRTGISSAQHLVISGANNNSSFRVATHVRSVNGILQKSGFDQANTRVNVTHNAFGDRLRFNFNLAITRREADFSFPEAFRYAALFNPTSPIRFPSGDYFQAFIFDNYNPASVIGLNTNEGTRRNTNYSGKIDFDISKHFTATLNLAQQTTSNLNGSYFSSTSMYMGLTRGGLAQRYTDESHFTLAESYLTYNHVGEKVSINLVGGFSYQVDRTETFGVQLGNFPNDELGYNALKYSGDLLAGQPNLIDIFSTTTPNNKVAGEFMRGQLSIGDAITFSGSVRRDGSSKLGKDNNVGIFYSTGVNADLLRGKDILGLQSLHARLGYGTTGALPTQTRLSQDAYDYSFSNGGTSVQVREANPGLKWEQRNELNFGIDFWGNRFSGSLDLYRRKQKGLIMPIPVNSGSIVRYENSADLSGKGLELTLEYYVLTGGDFKWNTRLVLSGNRTVLDKYPVEKETRSSIDAPGFGSTQMIRVAVGEKLGQIWGPVYDKVGINGYPNMKDVNGDGVINANPGTGLLPGTDFTSLGYGIPSWELGWGNNFYFRNWKLIAFFRGAFGHSMLNVSRMVYEPLDLGAINSYNRIHTGKAVDGLAGSAYSSLYVERADFLKLDNVTLEYSFPTFTKGLFHSLSVYGTVQNAFVISSYSGVDPEPVLYDRYPTAPRIQTDVLAPGIDRNGNYLPARTFTIGIAAGI